MEITNDMIDNALTGAVASLKEQLTSELKNGVSWEVREKASAQIIEFTTKWISENIIPEVEKTLLENKTGMLSLAGDMSNEILTELKTAMQKELKQKLEKSYSRSAIFKALFN